MPRERTVIYVPDIGEATERLDLPIESPADGEDWGLIAEGEAYVRIEFIYSGETVRIARTAYNRLSSEYPAGVFTLTNPTRRVLDVGSDAILDLNNGEFALEGLGNQLPKAVATVFAMQANEGLRDWPELPEATNEKDGVPSVVAVEPIYPDLDAETSRWVSCTLEWDAEREVFVNSQADPDWELDDEAAPGANYIVHNKDYGSLNEAMVRALEDTEWEQASPAAVVELNESESPEWGATV